MTTKVRKARAKKAVTRAIRKIAPETAQEILEMAGEVAEQRIEKSGKREPGQTIDGTSKVPWTRAEIEKRFPTEEIFSEENVQITWNGVTYQLLQNATHYVPSVIKTAYLNHRRGLSSTLTREKLSRELSHTGFETIVELGAGATVSEEFK